MITTQLGTIPATVKRTPSYNGYTYAKTITIPKAKITDKLNNFPLPVYLNTNNFDFTKCKSDGSDIRFTDSQFNPLKFEKRDFVNTMVNAFGDGSQNMVSGAYTNKIYYSNTLYTGTYDTYFSGNCNNTNSLLDNIATTYGKIIHNNQQGNGTQTYVTSGTNTYTLPIPIVGGRIVDWYIHWGNLSGSKTIGALGIVVNGVAYTMSQAVIAGIIKPLVLINSQAQSTSYVTPNAQTVYDGANVTGNFSNVRIGFQLNSEYTITAVRMYASATFATSNDGFNLTSYSVPNIITLADTTTLKRFGNFNVLVPEISATEDTIIYVWSGHINNFNKIPNPNFETSTGYNLVRSAISTDTWKYGVSSLKTTSLNDTVAQEHAAYMTSGNPTVISGHKYYISIEGNQTVKYTGTNSGVCGVYMAGWNTTSTILCSTTAYLDLNKVNEWQRASTIYTPSDNATLTDIRFGHLFGNVYDGTMYIDGAICVDLTDIFGVGKEPTKAWCDTNIGLEQIHGGSIEAWKDMTGKSFTYNGNCKLVDATTTSIDYAIDTKYNYKNMVSNWSFENGLNRWYIYSTGSASTVIDTSQKKFGTQSVKLVGTDTDYTQIYQFVPLIAGHKYYASVHALRTASLTSYAEFDMAGISPEMDFSEVTNATLPNINTWYKLSAIRTAPMTVDGYFRVFSSSINPLYLDGFTLIDLTKVFGIGNEPDVAWCDANIICYQQDVVNMLNNGGFENGSIGFDYLNGNTITSDEAKFGTYSLSNTSSYIYNHAKSNTIPASTYDIGDKILLTYWLYIPVNDDNSYAYSPLHDSIADRTGMGYTGKTDGWKKIQQIWTVPSNIDKATLAWYFAGWASAGISGVRKQYVDGASMVNLTRMFGTGNEPDTAWCDINMTYQHKRVFYPNGGYITLADSEDWNFGSNPFCIEVSCKFDTLPSTGIWNALYAHRTAYNSNYSVGLFVYNNAGAMKLYVDYSIDGVTAVTTQYDITLDTINTQYFTMNRIGNVIRCFHNGRLLGTISLTGAIYNSTDLVYLGAYPNSGTYTSNMNGYILGYRITKGRGRYSIDYAPEKSFYVDGSDVVFCTNFDTIYDNSYVMVQHLDSNLIDATGNNNSGTATGTTIYTSPDYGNVRSFNGTSDYILIPRAGVQPIHLNASITSYKTNWQSGTDERMFSITEGGGYNIGHDTLNNIYMYVMSNNVYTTGSYSGASLTPGWHHFAIDFDGRFTQLIIDGATVLKDDKYGVYNINYPVSVLGLFIGAEASVTGAGGSYFNGYELEMRLSSKPRSAFWMKLESIANKNNLIRIADY